MNEKRKAQLKYIMLLIICFCIALFVQMIYLKFCHFCFRATSNYITDPTGNILEHFYMFFFLFIITFIIGKYKKIDFGYHFIKFKIVLRYILIFCGISLIFSLIDTLFGIKRALNIELLLWILFQFFFSGFGEEIVFRSVPMIFFDKYAKGKDIIISIKDFNIDLSMLLSSLLFMIGHISVYSNQAFYSFIYGLMYVFFYRYNV